MAPNASATSQALTREPAPHPYFDSPRFPWHRDDAVALHKALYENIRDIRAVDLLYLQSGPDLLPLNQSLPPNLLWKDALESMATARCLKRFCELLLGANAYSRLHPCVIAAQQASASPADAVAIVRTGLRALEELLREPEVRAALAAFRAIFEGADRRIRRLSDFKDLHDRLHDLQVRCYAPISSASRQFPGAGTKPQLTLDAITLRGEIRKIQEIASRDTLREQDLSWIDEVVSSADLLEAGLAESNADKVQGAARRLRQVVHTQPTWVDRLLLQGAIELDLPQLVAKLREVARTLERVGAEPEQRRWVESGAEELGRLDDALTQARLRHRDWQKVDNSLRMLEGALGHSWQEIAEAWQTVHAGAMKLWVPGETWSDQLRQSGELLQQAINARNEAETRVFFSGFHTFATDRFYQVDKELKALCDQIAPIGRDLDHVVARME